MDRMRESLFAILGDLEGKSFLDMFSGSGICALEAASRGADPVFLVEKDPLKVDTILKNVSIAPHRVECKFMSVELFLKRTKERFDIIYLDPPFPYKFHASLIEMTGSLPVLKEGGLSIIHRPKEREMPDAIGNMQKTDERAYGRSIVDFYTKTGQPMV
jgi:16S rRNA (guanine966-N2)-methyltransferase